MAHDELFYQVHLQKGNTHQVAWIAARGAKTGAVVELLDEPEGEDRKGWVVTDKSFGHPITREQAISLRDAWRTQRDASDI